MANPSKPKRNELATGGELQDGRAKYTSATSLSKIQGLRKGLIIALLLDLDSPPPNSEDVLRGMNKPALAVELWRMVCCYIRFYRCRLGPNICDSDKWEPN